jgi:hypothetical protein
MSDPVERRLRERANGDEAAYQRLLKAHRARVEKFLDRIDPARTARRLARAYRGAPSAN